VDVILRDGSTLRLRAPTRDDEGALIAFFERLSDHSRYLRFHGARRVDATLVEYFLDPNWADRGALIGALTDAEGNERVVALAEYARLRDPLRAGLLRGIVGNQPRIRALVEAALRKADRKGVHRFGRLLRRERRE